MAIEILQTRPLLASCERALAERYTVHRLHEQADPEAWFAATGARIRAHAGSGVQAPLMDRLPNLEIIAGFGDVFEHEPQVPAALLGLDNVVLSPHRGSATRQTRDAMGALLVANLDRHFAGEPLISAVV